MPITGGMLSLFAPFNFAVLFSLRKLRTLDLLKVSYVCKRPSSQGAVVNAISSVKNKASVTLRDCQVAAANA